MGNVDLADVMLKVYGPYLNGGDLVDIIKLDVAEL